jgi:hypothetical protein
MEAPQGQDAGATTAWSHGVHLYASDDELLASLEDYLLDGWSRDGAGIVIATKEHRRRLRERLAGHALGHALGGGRYVELDAADALRLFMRDDMPDRQMFHDTVGSLVRDVARERTLHAFGEMVDVLWAGGNAEGALSLERLWGELQQEVEFALLCGYAHAGVDGDGRATIVQAHDHVELRSVSWGC